MARDPAHLLVVDDDPVILKMTARVLEGAGYRVTTATTGADALRLAQEVEPDLILLDVVLPDVEGVEVCRRIKATPTLNRTHVILLSGVKTEADAQAFGLESGADGYIARPVANRELLARVEAMLRLKQVEDALAEQARVLEEEVARRQQVEEALRHSEAHRIQQERLAAIGQLTTGLAHTFNNILGGLMLRTDLALNKHALPPDARETLQWVKEQSAEAAVLVEKLLHFSGRALMRRVRLDLAQFVPQQVGLLQALFPAGVDVTLAVQEADGYEIEGDADHLGQAFLNLALNAQDAMPDGGTLHVELRAVIAATVCSACRQPVTGAWIQLAFRDTGVGIDAETLPRIFEPFFTTRVPERQGLGLSQVLGIVEQHGGHIDVESEVGTGTAISLYLPTPDQLTDIHREAT